jgi:hypothetical protein
MMLSKENKTILLYVLVAVAVYYLFLGDNYRTVRKNAPAMMPKAKYTLSDRLAKKKATYDMPKMPNMGTRAARARQQFDVFGNPTSGYEMETMSGTNFLDGASVTTPISSTGLGTRSNMLYDIRPQPQVSTDDPLADYVTTKNPVLNNNLY